MKKAGLLLYYITVLLCLFFQGCNNGESYILKKTAERLNNSCPLEIDELTYLKSCEFIPDKTIKFNYVDIRNIVDPKDVEKYRIVKEKDIMDEMIELFNDTAGKELKSKEPVMWHIYRTEDGTMLYEKAVTYEMYNIPATKAAKNERVFSYIQKVIPVIKPDEPWVTPYGNIDIEIEAVYPRTMVYNFIMNDVEKTPSFDVSYFNDHYMSYIKYRVESTYEIYKLYRDTILSRMTLYDKNREELLSSDFNPYN